MALMDIGVPAAALSPWPARPTTTEGDLTATPVALSTIRALAAGSLYALRNVGAVAIMSEEAATAPDPANPGAAFTIEPGAILYARVDTLGIWAWAAGGRIEISTAPWWRACLRLMESCGGVLGIPTVLGMPVILGKPTEDGRFGRADSIGAMASARIERTAPGAPQAVKDEAMIRYAGYVSNAGFGAVAKEGIGPKDVEYVTRHAPAWLNSGAAAIIAPYVKRRAAAIG